MRFRRHGYRGQSRAISQQLPVNSTVRPCPPLGLSYQASATIKGVTSTARTVQAKRVIRAVENAHEQTRHLDTCQTRSARSAIAANPSPPLLDVPANLVTEKIDPTKTMKYITCAAPLVFLGALFAFPNDVPAQNPPQPNDQPELVSEPQIVVAEEHKPFLASAQAFVDAYAKRDATAIGNMFTADAEFLDEFGELTQGREAIIAVFDNVFRNSQYATIDEIAIERIRKITNRVVMEEGVVLASESPDHLRTQSRYVALHTLEADGKWRINSLKNLPAIPVGRKEQLEQLAWLTGNWVNEDDDAVVHTNCSWSEDGNYLLRRFTVQTRDGNEMNGVQRIGWDPARKKIRSWTFDSDGGFFSGLWTKHGKEWLLTSAGVTASGETVTATSAYTLHDAEMVTWQYRSLIVAGNVREDMEPITMVKRPPPPTRSAK